MYREGEPRNSSTITSLYSPNRLVFLITAQLFSVRGELNLQIECRIVFVFKLRPLALEASVRSQPSPCKTFGGKSDTGTSFSPSTLVFPSQYPSTNAPYSSSSTCCYCQDKGLSLRTFKNDISEMDEHWLEDVLSSLWAYIRVE